MRWGKFIHLHTNDARCCPNGLIDWGRVSPDTESNEQVDQPGLGRVWSISIPYPPHSIVIIAQHDITDRKEPAALLRIRVIVTRSSIDR